MFQSLAEFSVNSYILSFCIKTSIIGFQSLAEFSVNSYMVVRRGRFLHRQCFNLLQSFRLIPTVCWPVRFRLEACFNLLQSFRLIPTCWRLKLIAHWAGFQSLAEFSVNSYVRPLQTVNRLALFQSLAEFSVNSYVHACIDWLSTYCFNLLQSFRLIPTRRRRSERTGRKHVSISCRVFG